jgi:type IV pilus assembly protein PilW
MISITLGLFVVLAATALLLSTKATYISQEEGARIQDTGRHALDIISRAVRQAAYENWDTPKAPVLSTALMSADIEGLDARSLKSTSNDIGSTATPSINGSDVLAVKFFGAGAGKHGDGTIINCAGFGIPAARSQATAEQDRGWSIFYVATDKSGEPELYCKYRGAGDEDDEREWTSQAIARGVESFQVLYGIDTDADSLPNQFITATAINALDEKLVLEGEGDNANEKNADINRKTHWKKVVVVKVGLLVRGAESARSDTLTTEYDLFGKDYADAHAAADRGTRIKEAELPEASRNRGRKIFTTTIQLRNQAAGSTT